MGGETLIFMEDESLNYKAIAGRYLYHWPLFLLCLFLTISISFIYLHVTSPVFKTKATILIKDRDNRASALGELGIFQENKVVENEIQILRSKALSESVVRNLALNVSYSTDSGFLEKPVYKNNPVKFYPIEFAADFAGAELVFRSTGEKTFSLTLADGKEINGTYGKIYHSPFGAWKIDNIGGNTSVLQYPLIIRLSTESSAALQTAAGLSVTAAGQNSSILELVIEDQMPERGIDILNELIHEYNKAAVEDKNKVTASTLHFVNERLDSLSMELTSAEKDVEHFKSSNGLVNISSESQLFLDQTRDADQKLAEMDIQLSVINGIERYAGQPSADGNSVPTTLGLNDPVLLRLISNLSDLQARRASILANGTPDNPVLMPVQSQIASTRKAILESIYVLKSTLLNSKKKIKGNLSGIEGAIRSIPAKEREFIGLQRKQTIKDNLVTFLLQKREEAALAYASAIADSRIVDQAYVLPVPVRPKKPMTYALAIFIGLFLPFSWVFCKDIFDTRIRQSSEVAQVTQVPVAGELADEPDSASLLDFEKRGVLSEQFRALRANLKYLYGKKEGSNVLLVTSSVSGEGKSFVSLNLGMALALTRRKTVVLEFDLRKPKVASYAGIAGKPGLSNYLIGGMALNELVQPSGKHPDLFIISAGYIPPNPSELLEEASLVKLLDYLKGHFDEIIIDTPPIGLVSDALLLASLADICLYVVRMHHTEHIYLKKLKALYQEKKFRKMAVVINGENQDGPYGYGYDYGYYDGEKRSVKPIRTRLKRFIKRLV